MILIKRTLVLETDNTSRSGQECEFAAIAFSKIDTCFRHNAHPITSAKMILQMLHPSFLDA